MQPISPQRRRLGAVAGIALGSMLVTGCVASERGEGGDGEGTFVFAASAEPVSLDPAFASDGESFRVSRQIFEGLVGVEQGTADPAPLLAESWEASDDGTSYTFELKDDVVFHDGTEFNAEAVCFNFDRWYNFEGIAQSPGVAYYYGSLFRGYAGDEDALYDSCEADGDEGEVTINLTSPWAGFIAAMSLPAFAMQSPAALEEYSADDIGGSEEAPSLSEYATGHPTGTGPFVFESWEPGSQVELSAFEDYWGDQGDVTDIIFRVIDDPNARRQALEAGTIDGYDLVAPADTQALEDAGFQIVPRDPFTILYLGFNQALPELQDVRVRQALSMAIDKEQLINQTLPEGTELATQFIPPSVAGYNGEVTTYDYDPEAARALLDDAGIPEGWTLQFNYPTNVSRPYMPTPEQVFTVLSSQLEAVGITIDPQPNEWGEYLNRVQNTDNHGVHLLGWTGDYNDTDNFVGVFFGYSKPEFGFDNPELFDALNEARATPLLEDQLPLYEDINQMIAVYLPAVPLAHPAPSLAFGERVESYPVSPVNDEVYNLVELAD